MSFLEETFRRLVEYPSLIVSGFIGGIIAAFTVSTLTVLLHSDLQLIDIKALPKNSIYSGSERLYSTVREGDDRFEAGEYERAWSEYEYARDALRRLQSEYSNRAQKLPRRRESGSESHLSCASSRIYRGNSA